MQIDWFTVIAQIINFLILVWLLKRFLYRPILTAIDERERKIASQLENATAKEEDAKSEKEKYIHKNATFDHEKKELMNKALTEAEKERQKLMEEARNEANKLRIQLEKSLKEMTADHYREIQQNIQKELIGISKKILSDLASVSLEEQTIQTFVQRLQQLNGDEKKALLEAFEPLTDPVIIRSGYELSSQNQTDIKQAVNSLLDKEIDFRFEKSPGLISGIELTANGYKLNWSISGYLHSLERSISDGIGKKVELKTE